MEKLLRGKRQRTLFKYPEKRTHYRNRVTIAINVDFHKQIMKVKKMEILKSNEYDINLNFSMSLKEN